MNRPMNRPITRPEQQTDWTARLGWLLAVVLAGALGARLAAPSHEPMAHASTAVAGDRVALLTADGGSDEICAVLDDRSESILVYRVNNPAGVELIARGDLPSLFRQARAGRPPRR
ncbi:MAG: hypothetical protein AAGK04_04840 [Planctomycetota bacterium]